MREAFPHPKILDYQYTYMYGNYPMPPLVQTHPPSLSDQCDLTMQAALLQPTMIKLVAHKCMAEQLNLYPLAPARVSGSCNGNISFPQSALPITIFPCICASSQMHLHLLQLLPLSRVGLLMMTCLGEVPPRLVNLPQSETTQPS